MKIKILFFFIIFLFSRNSFSRDYPSFSVSDLHDSIVLKTLFDASKIDSNGEAIWKPNFAEALQFNVLDDSMCHTQLDTVLYYDSSKYAAVIFETEVYGCHICAPDVSIAVFQKWKDDRWHFYRMKKFVTRAGSWGDLPKIKLVQFGKTSYGLEMDWGDMGQGYTEEGVAFYDFYDFNEIFSDQTHEDNEGTGDKEYSWDKSIKFVKSKKNSYYYDLLVNSTGTRGNRRNPSSQIVRLSEKERYRYDGRKYERVK